MDAEQLAAFIAEHLSVQHEGKSYSNWTDADDPEEAILDGKYNLLDLATAILNKLTAK